MTSLDPRPAEQLCTALGVDAGRLRESDRRPRKLIAEWVLRGRDVGVPSEELLVLVAAEYGGHISVKVLGEQLGQQIVFAETGSDGSFRADLQQLPQADELTVRLTIDKASLADTGHQATHAGFLYIDSLHKLMSEGPSAAGALWQGKPNMSCVVMAGDHDLDCTGPRLAIVGPQTMLRPPSAGAADATVSDVVLTPEHVHIEGDHQPTIDLASGLLLVTAATALADDSVVQTDGTATAYFASSYGRVALSIEPGPITLTRQQRVDLVGAHRWCRSEDGRLDGRRAGPLRARIAELLAVVREEDRVAEFAEVVPKALAAAKWAWRHGLSQEAAAAVQREIDALDDAAVAVDRLVAETQTLVDDLVSAAVAAVLTVGGGAIAQVLDPTVGAAAIRWIAAAYLAYVAVSAIVSVSRSASRIETLNEAYDTVRDRRAKLVGAYRLDDLDKARISDAKSTYRHWRWAAIGIYLALGLIAAVVALTWVELDIRPMDDVTADSTSTPVDTLPTPSNT